MPDDLPLVADAAIFFTSGIVVAIAGTRIARYSDAISKRTGIGEAAIGLLLLGAVTSLPELAVAVTATLGGHPALTVNDVPGSAAIHVVLVAIADIVFGRGALTSTLASPRVLLQGL